MSELYGLPDGWEWKTLEDIFLIERGGSPRPIKEYITEAEDGINWIKIGDTKKGEKYITETAQKIKPEGLKKSRLVEEGDFIMSNSMSFGRPYIVKTKGAIHDGWLLMREKIDNTDKDFFYYLLSSNYMYQQFLDKASGTTVKNLNIALVKTTNIPLPPLQEQKRIVAKLDMLFEKIDKAIALHQKNMDEADLFMGSVLNEVFGELEGKYEKKELNEMVSKLGDGLHGTPKYDEAGEYYFINGANVSNNKIIINQNTKKVNQEEYLKYKKELTNRTVFVSINGTIGNVGLYNNEKCMLGKSACYFNLLEDIDKIFITYVLKNGDFQQYIRDNATGATIKNVSLKTMRGYSVILPPLNIQQKTVKYLDQISEKTEILKRVQSDEMESLKALKASILDKAFRGEL